MPSSKTTCDLPSVATRLVKDQHVEYQLALPEIFQRPATDRAAALAA